MFENALYRQVSWKTYCNWFLMCFLSGNVNAGGYLAFHRFVTHVTGFATLFGVEAANGRWDAAVGILSVPMYFLIGVMISAYLIDRPFHLGRKPHYATVMGLIGLCLVLAGLMGHLKFFGPFGEVVKLKRDYFLLSLLCLSSGLQNAAITTASGASVRTTHMTGLTTDLGIGIIRGLTLARRHTDYSTEMRATRIRIGSILSFVFGSAVGASLFMEVKYLGFLLPAIIAGYAMIVAMRTAKTKAVMPVLIVENKVEAELLREQA